jgi:hypothetical protein
MSKKKRQPRSPASDGLPNDPLYWMLRAATDEAIDRKLAEANDPLSGLKKQLAEALDDGKMTELQAKVAEALAAGEWGDE